MAETLTDVDTFDATIQWPVANELASAADVRDKAIQRLANRTRNNKNRLDGHDTSLLTKVTAGVANYSIDVGTYGSGDDLALTLVQADSGYSLSSGTTVQAGSGGWHLVTLSMKCTLSSTSDPSPAGVQIKVGGSVKLYPAPLRHSTSASHQVSVSASGPIWIDTAATDTIKLTAQPSPGNLVVVNGTLGIIRIGAPV